MGIYDRIKDALFKRAEYSPVGAASLPLIHKLEQKKLELRIKELEKTNQQDGGSD